MLAAVPELLIDLGSSEGGSFGEADSPVEFEKVGDRVFFVANDGFHGSEVWVSDGTPEGTALVRDIAPTSEDEDDYAPEQLTNVNGTLFFTATNGHYRHGLWKSDGTEAGTVPVPGTTFTPVSPSSLVNVGGVLYFTSREAELWRSDGTEAGTYALKPFQQIVSTSSANLLNRSSPNLFNVNDTLYFVAKLEGTDGLWKSDGTENGTELVKTMSLDKNRHHATDHLTPAGALLYFTAYEPATGHELWRSDGTPEGTYPVSDLLPGKESSFPDELTVVGDTLYFTAIGAGTGRELWRTDGTAAGTELVVDLQPGIVSGFPANLTEYNGQLIFSAWISGLSSLWVTDGTLAGTVPLGAEPIRGYGYGNAAFAALNGILYFQASDAAHGSELWRTDGTPSGTRLVADVWPGVEGSQPTLMAPLGGQLLFAANDDTTQRELWRTDGTTEGTVLVKDIKTTKPEYGYVRDFTDVNGKAFFVAQNEHTGRELWLSGGTRAATVLVKGHLSRRSVTQIPIFSRTSAARCTSPPTMACTASSCGRATARPRGPC